MSKRRRARSPDVGLSLGLGSSSGEQVAGHYQRDGEVLRPPASRPPREPDTAAGEAERMAMRAVKSASEAEVAERLHALREPFPGHNPVLGHDLTKGQGNNRSG